MYRFPPKSKVLARDEVIEYVCTGDKPPTLVLVNGSGGPIEGWHKIFGKVAGFAKVFAYNRPGIGRSSKPNWPQTGMHMVESLRGVLQAASLPSPYLLVRHSFGGLIVNLFARLHPSEVSAAILVEATAPQDIEVLAMYENALQQFLRVVLDKLAPSDLNGEAKHVRTTVTEIMQAPAFPPIPLTVISGGKPAMAWATLPQALAMRAIHQKELAGLSPFGKHIMAGRSGHFPQFTEPELVIAAIREMADAALKTDASLVHQST